MISMCVVVQVCVYVSSACLLPDSAIFFYSSWDKNLNSRVKFLFFLSNSIGFIIR